MYIWQTVCVPNLKKFKSLYKTFNFYPRSIRNNMALLQKEISSWFMKKINKK